MPNRRDVIMLGVSAAVLASTAAKRAIAAGASPSLPRLETRLFNFKDDIPPENVVQIIATMKEAARSAGVDGLLVGRNFIPTPFPTRFEWLYMVQFDDFAAGGGGEAYRRVQAQAEDLAGHCRNQVQCDVDAAVPARFADASGVKVRHTVMFNFKPDATAEARERNVAAIRRMGRLPMVQDYWVEPSAAAELGGDGMEWQIIGDFASVADYRAYSEAPDHLAIRDDFTAQTSRVAFLDVEL